MRRYVITRRMGRGLLIVSAFLFANAAWDQHSGTTGSLFTPSRVSDRDVSVRTLDPERFRKEMGTEWIVTLVLALGGLGILGLFRSADRSDPFSSRYEGDGALDECKRSLDREWERRHRPMRWL